MYTIANEVRKCPKCWESDYTPWITTSTCMYFPPRIVNWVNINPDRNTITEERYCNKCQETTIIKR